MPGLKPGFSVSHLRKKRLFCSDFLFTKQRTSAAGWGRWKLAWELRMLPHPAEAVGFT